MSPPPSTPPSETTDGVDAASPAVRRLDPPLGEGDDDTLILWFLGLSVAERVAVAQDFVDSAAALKHGIHP